MMEFITLLVGLVVGPQVVELRVEGPISAVELRLDGQSIGTLAAPPWRLTVDLGTELVPHELVAVGRDIEGREVALERQWINLDPADDGLTPMVVNFASGVTAEATPPVFLLAGKPVGLHRLEAGAPEVTWIVHPAAQPYLDWLAKTFVEDELRQAFLRVPKDWDPNRLENRDAFLNDDAFLEPQPEAAKPTALERIWSRFAAELSLGEGVTSRFLMPLAAPASRLGRSTRVFAVSPQLDGREGGFLWHLAARRPDLGRLRLADAVALAGREAHAGRRPRAVVVLLADTMHDVSVLSPATVRKYLDLLQVPLCLWSFETLQDQAWGKVEVLRHRNESAEEARTVRRQLGVFLAELKRTLAKQQIAWLEGQHLPQQLVLAPGAAVLATSVK